MVLGSSGAAGVPAAWSVYISRRFILFGFVGFSCALSAGLAFFLSRWLDLSILTGVLIYSGLGAALLLFTAWLHYHRREENANLLHSVAAEEASYVEAVVEQG